MMHRFFFGSAILLIVVGCSESDPPSGSDLQQPATNHVSEKAKSVVNETEPIVHGDGFRVLEITDGNFEQVVLDSKTPVLVVFSAPWAMPGRMLAPTIEEIAKEFFGRVKVGEIDTDVEREVVAKFNIKEVPTILLFKDRQIMHKFEGVTSKQEFIHEIEKVM